MISSLELQVSDCAGERSYDHSFSRLQISEGVRGCREIALQCIQSVWPAEVQRGRRGQVK